MTEPTCRVAGRTGAKADCLAALDRAVVDATNAMYCVQAHAETVRVMAAAIRSGEWMAGVPDDDFAFLALKEYVANKLPKLLRNL